MRLSAGERVVLAFTLAYVAGFTAWFAAVGNTEFIGYVVTMLALIVLIAASRNTARIPVRLLWALSAWGLAHMAGGGVRVDGDVLYALMLVPLTGSGDGAILRYDQVVHFYGFAVAALVLRHLLRRHYPQTIGSWTLFAFPVLGSMGLGATNEIIEFAAVLALPDTNVGGYYNTGLDLVFNGAGALFASAAASILDARSGRRPVA